MVYLTWTLTTCWIRYFSFFPFYFSSLSLSSFLSLPTVRFVTQWNGNKLLSTPVLSPSSATFIPFFSSSIILPISCLLLLSPSSFHCNGFLAHPCSKPIRCQNFWANIADWVSCKIIFSGEISLLWLCKSLSTTVSGPSHYYGILYSSDFVYLSGEAENPIDVDRPLPALNTAVNCPPQIPLLRSKSLNRSPETASHSHKKSKPSSVPTSQPQPTSTRLVPDLNWDTTFETTLPQIQHISPSSSTSSSSEENPQSEGEHTEPILDELTESLEHTKPVEEERTETIEGENLPAGGSSDSATQDVTSGVNPNIGLNTASAESLPAHRESQVLPSPLDTLSKAAFQATQMSDSDDLNTPISHLLRTKLHRSQAKGKAVLAPTPLRSRMTPGAGPPSSKPRTRSQY